MKAVFLFLLIVLLPFSLFAQTKVSGIVVDDNNLPMPYATVAFKGSTIGIVTNEDGKFYLESKDRHTVLVASFVGYTTEEITLTQNTMLNLKIVLKADNLLDAVQIYGGKTSKKNNPAIDILRKIWERKRKNGLYMFDQYQIDKYEKIEFDLNNIDSTFAQKKIFKGM